MLRKLQFGFWLCGVLLAGNLAAQPVWTPINNGLTNLDVRSIAIDPGNPSTLYAGTAGGVFKSVDGGSSWTPSSNGLSDLAMGQVVVDPTNSRILYGGTFAGGVHKSTDGGNLWSPMNVGLPTLRVTPLAVHLQNNSIVYAGPDAFGIYRSTDGGNTWDAAGGGRDVRTFALNPTDPAEAYAATVQSVLKTTDNGATWVFGPSGLPNPFINGLAAHGSVAYAGPVGNGVWRSIKNVDFGQWKPSNAGMPAGATAVVIKINPLNLGVLYAGTDGFGVFKSTDGGRNWTALNDGLTNLNIGRWALAIDPVNPEVVYVGTVGGGIFELGGGAPPVVPVVLVHGWCGEPNVFGEMGELLTEAGLTVGEPFDYSALTRVPAFADTGVAIEQLAAIFAGYVLKVLKDHGANQVDVVAHSMGGLVVRAWMAGRSAAAYQGQIRRLVTTGTPHYGTDLARLFHLLTFPFGGLVCSGTQGKQMRFGSSFLMELHKGWIEFQQTSLHRIAPENTLFIAGTQDDQPFPLGQECNDSQGCDDGIVDISSAVLPDSPSGGVRYVPYKHSARVRPPDSPIMHRVENEQHKSYQLIREFLKTGAVLNQCCDDGTVDYNPPHLRGDTRRQEGLLVLRLIDTETGQPLTGRAPRLAFEPFLVPGLGYAREWNRGGGTLTIWGIPTGIYNVNVLRGRKVGRLENVQIKVARPTVPGAVEMSRRRGAVRRLPSRSRSGF